MKVLSRDFTMREKVLLIILSLFLIGVIYYYFVDQPVRSTIADCKDATENLKLEEIELERREQSLQKMQDELESATDSKLAIMASYDASKDEIHLLNDVLGKATWYSIAFTDLSRDGDQIRRCFSLQYRTEDYNSAREILKELYNSEYRCLLGDLRVTGVNNDIQNGEVLVNVSATFYETMVGATTTQGLPAAASDADDE